jgi:hypothetical protein
MAKNGFMLFKEEGDPCRPHPDTSPDDSVVSFNADGFFLAYGVFDNLKDALLDAQDHLEEVINAVARGDMQDADEIAYPRPVTVNDDGSVIVFEENGVDEICRYSIDEIYDFFGVAVPQDDMPSM